jgi:predicted Zn-dependent protease
MFESEADFFGLQYVYKAGYDPTAFIDLLERLETAKHEKPNRVMGMLSTHPAIMSRSLAIQKKIQKILPPKPDYVVNTSEFDNIKGRLQRIYEGRHQTGREWRPPNLQLGRR